MDERINKHKQLLSTSQSTLFFVVGFIFPSFQSPTFLKRKTHTNTHRQPDDSYLRFTPTRNWKKNNKHSKVWKLVKNLDRTWELCGWIFLLLISINFTPKTSNPVAYKLWYTMFSRRLVKVWLKNSDLVSCIFSIPFFPFFWWWGGVAVYHVGWSPLSPQKWGYV